MDTAPSNTNRLMNEKEVAAFLAVSLGTVRRWRLTGAGPKATKLAGLVRYKPSDIEEFLNQCPTLGGGKRGGR
jgi:predicted DNA-binding transcriptional regulator AlpA